MNARSVALSTLSVVALAGCGGKDVSPPPNDAAKLVPRDALVYVHVSADTSRDATKAALKLAKRFPGFARYRDDLLKRLGCGRGEKDIALALLSSKTGTARSMVIVDGGKRRCGAKDRPARGESLADDPLYARTLKSLPADRVADAWVTRDGVRRLLAPQDGLLGVVGSLLNQPRLRAVAASASPDGEHRARIVVRSVLTPGTAPGAFEPKLADLVPDNAIAYIGARGVPRQLLSLFPDAPAGLSGALSGEVAAVFTRASPLPVLTLISTDTARAAALRRLGFVTASVDGKLVASTNASGIRAVRQAKRHLPDTSAWASVQPNLPKRIGSLVFLDLSQLLRLAERTGILQRLSAVGVRSSGDRDETTAEIFLSIP